MKNIFFYIIIYLFISLNGYSSTITNDIGRDSINDGPYIFKRHDKFKVKWVEKGELYKKTVTADNFQELKTQFNLSFTYQDLLNSYILKPEFNQDFENVDSIAVISDIHGEFNGYINLLKAARVIDDSLKWSFGTGHLVVLGDVFDRGDMVTEVFWHVFGLEQQAKDAGGMVHVIVGNHESLILGKDLFYTHPKYIEVDTIAHTTYFDLYSRRSVLGSWLRTKPIIISINNNIYIHAGLSFEMVKRKLPIPEINEIFYQKILGKDEETIALYEKLNFLNGDDGPLWYRGYFNDSTFNEKTLDAVLGFYGKEKIIVGHTTFKEIITLFNDKIIAVDAGLMDKLPGEVLLWEKGVFYRVMISGKRLKI